MTKRSLASPDFESRKRQLAIFAIPSPPLQENKRNSLLQLLKIAQNESVINNPLSIESSPTKSYGCLSPKTPPTIRSFWKAILKPNKQLQVMLETEDIPQAFYFVKKDIRKVIAWMSIKCNRFGYIPETFYMSVVLFDRYTQSVKVTMKNQLYAIAACCIYMNGKLVEELLEPKLDTFIIICDLGLTRKKIKDTERKILKVLDWRLPNTTPYSIFHEFMNSLGYIDPRDDIHALTNLIRNSIGRSIVPLIHCFLDHLEYSCVVPSLLLRASLEYLISKNELSESKINMKALYELLPADTNDVQELIEYLEETLSQRFD